MRGMRVERVSLLAARAGLLHLKCNSLSRSCRGANSGKPHAAHAGSARALKKGRIRMQSDIPTHGAPAVHLAYSQKPVVQRDRFLRLPAVEELTGFRKSTIYEWMRTGRFPKPARLGARMVAWPETAVLQWVQDRIAESQGGEA